MKEQFAHNTMPSQETDAVRTFDYRSIFQPAPKQKILPSLPEETQDETSKEDMDALIKEILQEASIPNAINQQENRQPYQSLKQKIETLNQTIASIEEQQAAKKAACAPFAHLQAKQQESLQEPILQPSFTQQDDLIDTLIEAVAQAEKHQNERVAAIPAPKENNEAYKKEKDVFSYDNPNVVKPQLSVKQKLEDAKIVAAIDHPYRCYSEQQKEVFALGISASPIACIVTMMIYFILFEQQVVSEAVVSLMEHWVHIVFISCIVTYAVLSIHTGSFLLRNVVRSWNLWFKILTFPLMFLVYLLIGIFGEIPTLIYGYVRNKKETK